MGGGQVVARCIDRVGWRCGSLVVVRRSDRRDGDGRLRYWTCRCDCGRVKDVHVVALRSESTSSCGCRRIEMICAKKKEHGLSRTPIYMVWRSMIRRCYDPKHHAYAGYGGRGLTVCAAWLDSVTHFVEDMGPRPPGATLDRTDNMAGYSPDNCRWATRKEQANNRRCCRFLAHGDIRLTVAQWAERQGICENALRQRLRHGWPVSLALTKPIQKKGGA